MTLTLTYLLLIAVPSKPSLIFGIRQSTTPWADQAPKVVPALT